MEKDTGNSSNLRRSCEPRKAVKGQDLQQQQEHRKLHPVNCVLPDRELKLGEMHVSCLPPEILTGVFRWLPTKDLCRVARVCTGWRDLVYHKSFWSDVTFVPKKRQDDSKLDPLLLDSLALRDFRTIQISDPTMLSEITRCLPNLQRAFLTRYQFSPVTWSGSLLGQMTNLVHLEFSLTKDLTDDTIRLVADHLNKLVTLYLESCYSLTNRSLEYVATGLPELKNLSLYNCTGISDAGVTYLCGSGLEHPPAKLPQLQYLNLHSCRACSDLAIRHLSRGQPSIQQLNLSGLKRLSDTVFKWLATMRELRHLNISNTYLTGSGLVELANAHSPLTHLDLTAGESLTDQALEHVGQLKRLTALVIDRCLFSYAGLAMLVKGGDSPIRELRMRNCDGITDDGMRPVAQLTQLQRLDYYVGDVGLAHLADGQSPVSRVLCWDNVTDVGLGHAARLPNLRSLDMRYCIRVTNAGLKEFAAKVRGPVTELHLWLMYGWFERMDVETLLCVARGLPALTTLSMQNRYFEMDELLAAARLMPRLHTLGVDHDNCIDKVRSQFDGHFFQ